MNNDDLQKRYDHLLDRVARMRHHQIRVEKWGLSDDKKRKRELERQVDNLVKDEMKKKDAQQKECF